MKPTNSVSGGTNRTTAILVGALFLISYFGVFAGYALIGPLIESPEYLSQLNPHKTQVMIGVLLEIVNGIAVLAIAVLMYPLLKQYGEGLALGYIAFRVLECGMQVAMDMSPLALLTLSERYLENGATAAPQFEILGALYLAERDAASLMLLIFFVAGALLFYFLLYRSQLLPRFVSVWGIIALLLIVTMNVLDVRNMDVGMIFALPIMANEIILALWLIIKGFNPAALAFKPALSTPAIIS